MAIEIERRFLVKPDAWHQLVSQQKLKGKRYVQGYLCMGEKAVIRVRIADTQAWITIKGKTSHATRTEFEYPIPVADAQQMLRLLTANTLIQKTRYHLATDEDGYWEVDVFHDENEGLIIAERELMLPGQFLILPEWIDREITEDPRFYNMNLALHPFKNWSHELKS
ncbi:MAG: CYTH domain-containing protein [Thermoflavifilum aggregans]|mgnify:CR=1 FL=1|uniref:CYTH domain-containing protein n=1 Tax=Thermoflavifilum thermophilum TaxID=1393122 RepID=A0A1I7NN12_9BACT|nr:CYTH domain-containing protein [Thermoflavifilum thermophilum]MBX6380004.1 CYTH domain-containing protein [Thermoflavifilum aggregans]SFV36058.1 CYTH domain-containing protein [Thermoflavifilum thermophilum]